MADQTKQLGSFAKLMTLQSGGKKETAPQKEPSITPKQKDRPTTDTITSNIACNITILQSDIEKLRQPAYATQTFRMRDEDKEWVKDTAYMLSKETPKKVSQTDIVRIAFTLFDKVLAANREEVKALLKTIL